MVLDPTHVDFIGRDGDTLLDSFIFAGKDLMVRDVWSAGRHMVREGRHIKREEIVSKLCQRYARTWGCALKAGEFNSWQDVQDEVLQRIQSRQWKPGALIPNEVALAEEFGCARATVNRALRAVADQGLIDRRRKAGTRVALHPVRRATLKIPIIRQEIEGLGRTYSYHLVSSEMKVPPQSIGFQMNVAEGLPQLHLSAIHKADGKPYVFEDRWLNPDAVDHLADVDFDLQNANEWLVQNAPFTHGDISFSAAKASRSDAQNLETQVGEPLFVIERMTWNDTRAITWVKLLFAPGYQMNTDI